MDAPPAPRRRGAVALAILAALAVAAVPVFLDDGGDDRPITVANRPSEDPGVPFEPPTTSSRDPEAAPSSTTTTSGPARPVRSPVTSTTRPAASSTSTSRPPSTTAPNQPALEGPEPPPGNTTTTVAPCPPPANSASRTLSEAGLYVVPIDGGPPRRLQIGKYGAESAVFSADGRHVVYFGNGPAGHAIYSGNADGTGLTQLNWNLAERPVVESTRQVSWSPDGQWLGLFKRPYNGENSTIWVMAPDGSQLRKVFTYPEGVGGIIRGPEWSPDGKHLAVGGGGAWVIDVESATSRELFRGNMFDIDWAPESDRIVVDPWGPVTLHPDGTSSHQNSIEIFDATTGARRALPGGGVVYTWAPSGDIIVGSPRVVSDTGELRPYRFLGIARTFASDGRHVATEDAETVFVYDEHWCGRPLVDVTGPSEHWLGWAGPSAMLVNVNPG